MKAVGRAWLAVSLLVGAAHAGAAHASEPVSAPRDVTDPRMIRLEPATDDLTRLAPRAAVRSTLAKPIPAVHRFYRVVVLDAGHFRSNDTVIAIPRVEAPAADAMCGPSDAAWPCGLAARNALRRLIRARAVACETDGESETLRACHVGPISLADWLIGQGWAAPIGETGEEDGLTAAHEAARAAKIGLYASR